MLVQPAVECATDDVADYGYDGGGVAGSGAVGGRRLDDDLFLWSGKCIVDLLDFLTSRGISAATSGDPDVSGAFPVEAFVFGPLDRPLLTRLDPDSFTSEELAKSLAAFDFDETEAVFAATDGLNALRVGIGTLGDGDLLVITVG